MSCRFVPEPLAQPVEGTAAETAHERFRAKRPGMPKPWVVEAYGHRIEIDEAAGTIRRIFDEYLKGNSYAAIAQVLNREAVRLRVRSLGTSQGMGREHYSGDAAQRVIRWPAGVQKEAMAET